MEGAEYGVAGRAFPTVEETYATQPRAVSVNRSLSPANARASGRLSPPGGFRFTTCLPSSTSQRGATPRGIGPLWRPTARLVCGTEPRDSDGLPSLLRRHGCERRECTRGRRSLFGRTRASERWRRVTGHPQDVVDHLVTHHQWIAFPRSREHNAVVRKPRTRASTRGAREVILTRLLPAHTLDGCLDAEAVFHLAPPRRVLCGRTEVQARSVLHDGLRTGDRRERRDSKGQEGGSHERGVDGIQLASWPVTPGRSL
jgi:hypothetical protein